MSEAMRFAIGRIAGTVVVAACLTGMSAMAHAQAGGSRAGNGGNGGLGAAPSSVNAAGGGGTVGSTLTPTPGLAAQSGAVGSGRTGSAGTGSGLGMGTGLSPGRVLNNMRANGTSLNQNPDPRVPSLSGRPAAPR